MARILVIRGGAIGDFILTMPTLELIRNELPDPHVEVLGYESITSLAVEFGFAEAIRSIEHRALAAFFVPNAKLDEALSAYFASFSLIVSFLFDPDDFFHTNLEKAGARTVIRGSHRVDNESGIPAAKQLSMSVEQLALFLEKPYVSFGIRPEKTWNAIAVHPGSGSPTKNWGYERWAEVIGRLHHARPEFRFHIISGEAEAESLDEFIAMLESAKIPHESIQAPLPEVARQLAHCALFLGHDSGVSHLAGACEVPSLLLFGPTLPEIWAPQNSQVQTIHASSGNLAGIRPDEVVEQALAMLAASET